MPEDHNNEIKQPDHSENEEMVMPESSNKVHHSHLGPMLGVLVVVFVLILSGLYLWGSTLREDRQNQNSSRTIENNEPETPRAEADAQILNTVSSSNELDAIEADLESTNLDELEADLEKIDQEFDAALGEE